MLPRCANEHCLGSSWLDPGDANLVHKLQQAARALGIADRVLWPGMLSGATKWAAFSEAEAFILPSHQENFGIAVAEALSCSTPVLISDQVNIHTDIVSCRAGYVEPDTLHGTEGLLRRWADTPGAERAAMRSRSFLCWQSHFDSAGTSRAIVDIFRAAQPKRPSVAIPALAATCNQSGCQDLKDSSVHANCSPLQRAEHEPQWLVRRNRNSPAQLNR